MVNFALSRFGNSQYNHQCKKHGDYLSEQHQAPYFTIAATINVIFVENITPSKKVISYCYSLWLGLMKSGTKQPITLTHTSLAALLLFLITDDTNSIRIGQVND